MDVEGAAAAADGASALSRLRLAYDLSLVHAGLRLCGLVVR